MTTTFEILLFGPLSARLGRSSVQVELDRNQATCGVLRRAVSHEYPEVESLLPSHRFARNHELVDDDTAVEPDDELALIGMVSGG